MRYLKLFEDYESEYDYKKDPVINDLKELSLDLIDDGCSLIVFLHDVNEDQDINDMAFIKFDHEVDTISKVGYSDQNYWSDDDEFIGPIPSGYTFGFITSSSGIIDTGRDSHFSNSILEFELIIKEMYPNINIRTIK